MIVFITGGSSGIGLAIAQQLSKANGNTICLFARDTNKLEIAKNTLSNAEQHHVFSLDATDFESVNQTIKKAVQSAGVPDLVINCVGRAVPGYFQDITPAMMHATMQANFYATWNIVKVLLPYLKIKGGSVINTASVAGFMGVFGYSDYAASKFAVVGFSETLRQELKQYNIKVQVLCPPDTLTPGFEEENKTKPKETLAISAGAKVMHPEQVAAEAIKGMQGNRFLIIPGMDGKVTWWLKRYLPFVINWVINRSIKRAQKQ